MTARGTGETGGAGRASPRARAGGRDAVDATGRAADSHPDRRSENLPDRARLILALNEIWHDLETRAYDAKHPDILEEEIPRWDRALAEALAAPRGPVCALDFGSGTGFVPLRLAPLLGPGDRLICSDVSAGMLEVCRAKLRDGAGIPHVPNVPPVRPTPHDAQRPEHPREPQSSGPAPTYSLELLKLDGARIDLPDASVDLVTANAVMHHLPDPAAACGEIDRILKPGGRVLIGHEPTRTYGESFYLAANYWALSALFDFRQFAYEIILRLGLFEAVRKPLARLLPDLAAHNALVDGTNAQLLSAGLIDRPLRAAEISALLDAQSPNAGGPQLGRGFALDDFRGYFPGYRMERGETYTHLGKLPLRTRWLRRRAARLAHRFPEHGANLFCGMRKP